jgi:hypothetical protein
MTEKPASVRHYLRRVVTPKPSDVRAAVKDVEGFNAKFAVLITRGVGPMACAYLFAIIALMSLSDAIKAGRASLISWIAQTFPAARSSEDHHGWSDRTSSRV